ncbi:MAG: 5-(carboxyamino)imidazole ribonucleotide mutase [Terracidiphilus sp.]
MAEGKNRVCVGIVMGSKSDWPTMEAAAKVLDELGIANEAEVISARERGLRVIIAGAGGAAHLAGFLAAKTSLPVLGVPMKSSALSGLDSLLSIVQMPAGIPVATFAIGEAGAKNAGLFAAAILALEDKAIAQQLEQFRSKQTETVLKGSDPRA